MPDPVKVFEKIDMRGGDSSQCWPWKGKVNKKDGRPYFTVAGSGKHPAYAVVLELVSGEESNGRMALHHCDNPICCNPAHLYWGGHDENMNDMKERERHGLPRIVVRAIRTLAEEGTKYADIASRYGVSESAVAQIVRGATHKGD